MEVKWIKITTDIFDDEKMLLIESLPDSYAIITVWFKLLCLAGKQNNSGVFMLNDKLAYTDKMLATVFRMKESIVTMALNTFEQFGMIEIIDGVITIPNWGKHQSLDQLESRKEYMRNYMQEYREKQRLLTSGKPCKVNSKVNSKANVNALDKEEEKEIDIDIEKEKKSEKKRETTHTLFERLISDYIISDILQAKMSEWFRYKTERKEPYKEQGMKALLRKVENNALKYGDKAICNLIDDCMANNWKGIIFDRLTESKPKLSNSTDDFMAQLQSMYITEE